MPLTRRQRANAALKHSVSETEITQSLMDLASVVASIPEGARAGWYRSVQRYRNAPHPVAGNHYNLSAIASQWLRVADIVWAGYPEQDAGDRRAVATAEGRLSCPSHPLRESPAPATPSGAGGGVQHGADFWRSDRCRSAREAADRDAQGADRRGADGPRHRHADPPANRGGAEGPPQRSWRTRGADRSEGARPLRHGAR